MGNSALFYAGLSQAVVAGFVGALDGYTGISAIYSMRRLRGGYTANKSIRFQRSSDSAQRDLEFLANGDPDMPSLDSWKGAGTLTPIIWYDQSGSGNDAPFTIIQPVNLILDAGGRYLLDFPIAIPSDFSITTSGSGAVPPAAIANHGANPVRVQTVYKQSDAAGDGGAFKFSSAPYNTHSPYQADSMYSSLMVPTRPGTLKNGGGLWSRQSTLGTLCEVATSSGNTIYSQGTFGTFNGGTLAASVSELRFPMPAYGAIAMGELVFFNNATVDSERISFTANQKAYYNTAN